MYPESFGIPALTENLEEKVKTSNDFLVFIYII